MRAIWPDNISLEVLIPMIWCLVITVWEMFAVAAWIRSEVKQSWPYPKPIHVAGGRPFPLGRRTAVQRVCCECSSFQCELDAPTGADHDHNTNLVDIPWPIHEPYLRPDISIIVYKQMIQHCHIVAEAVESPSDILGLIWHFPATLHSWNLTWTRKVVWMERKSFSSHDS